MRKLFSIVHYEYKMQLNRFATWGVFIATMVIAMLDDFPSEGNLNRLEFLTEPAYFISRTMSIYGLVLTFGLLFLLSSRFPIDKKLGTKSLIMAAPIEKGQYIFGKLLGGFFYTFSLLFLFLTINTVIYFVAAPVDMPIMSCLIPLIKTLFVSAVPVSAFVGFVAVALPAIMDIRLFYLLASALFIVNAATTGSAGQMPFYIITSGDLIKLIWQHPKWPFINTGSIQANLMFLMGAGLLSCVLLFLKRKFWRAE